MATDSQPPVQTSNVCRIPIECAAICPRSRDLLVIAALVLCLLLSAWLGLCSSRLLVSGVLAGKTTGVLLYFVGFLIGTARGIFHFACGFGLARFLRYFNPWHVVAGLATVAALWFCVVALFRLHVDLHAATAVPLFLAMEVFGPESLLLLLSLGVWCQRRMARVPEHAATVSNR